MALTEIDEPALRQRLRTDLAYYAAACLAIRTKTGQIQPLLFNRAQRFLDRRLQEQCNRIGRVRALVLKGRQQGCSTYVGARFYHRATHVRGQRVFILTHEQEATDNLFGMVSRYHENCPEPVRAHTGASNAKELSFDRLDSGYKVGTAGTKGVGRSQTIQLFHGSEVGFWPHADTHAAGVLQAVPEEPGTEIVLESTANGLGNFFHQQWQMAEAGLSDFMAIFIPWFWQDEYRRPVEPGFRLEPEEQDYADAYGLDLEQMAWRRARIQQLGAEWMFKQEYPATAAEAFQTSGEDTFISPALALMARKAGEVDGYGPRVGGCDPARFGDVRTSMVLRQGRKVLGVDSWQGKDTMEVVGLCVKVIQRYRLAKLFVDVGGLGAGVVDRLREMGYGQTVVPVNGGERPMDPNKYFNKRAEMWGLMKEWLEDQPASIPDDDAFQADLCGIKYAYDSNSRLKLERKEDMKKRGLRSPDEADALALTFAWPVSPELESADRGDEWTWGEAGRNSVTGY